MTIVKIRCPHCKEELVVNVGIRKGSRAATATVLSNEEGKARLFKDVLDIVLDRHNGIAPLSILVLEASKNGLDHAYVQKMLNIYLNDGKLHIEGDNIMR
ncbi:MAG: hypothetical protein ACXQS3_06345 [Candidatus Methanofastidiosia archaeon]